MKSLRTNYLEPVRKNNAFTLLENEKDKIIEESKNKLN